MTPNSALTAIIARLNAAGFVECKSPNGLMDGGTQRLNQGFYVKPLQIKFLKGRHKSDGAGARVSMTFEVQLGHICKPSSGVTSSATAMTDIHTALKYLFAPDTSLTSGAGAAIYTNGVTVSYQEGGSYIIQKCVIDIHYNLDLTP
tara:strand:+ start:304 stop:741 length:438 start_codon:yes stop_codon:yes gene_type:complete